MYRYKIVRIINTTSLATINLASTNYMRIFFAILWIACSLQVTAQSFDHIKKEYTLVSLTESSKESARMQRMNIADQQPSGLYIGRGETIKIKTGNFDTAYQLGVLIGFKPLWGQRNKQFETTLKPGENTVTPTNEGILFFQFVKKNGLDINPVNLSVKVEGGKPFPLYVHGKTSPQDWKQQLDSFNKSVFVQLVSPKAMITIPYENYIKAPIVNLNNTLDTIHKVIDWENECAGFDGSSIMHMPTRLRMHFVVDTYKQNGDGYYMYATGHHVGILRDNFEELTNPRRLAREGWGIWHEVGHTHQQPSWRWDAIREISVNIFSLYVQEKFELATPFAKPNSATKDLTLFENAKRYMDLPNKDYSIHKPEDNNPLFTKMMMFWQLKESYGWRMIQQLHKYFRDNPDVSGTDQDKIDRFTYVSCLVTQQDLRDFFTRWGLKISAANNAKIASMNWRKLAKNPADNLTDKWKPKPINTQQLADAFLALQNAARQKKGLKPLKADVFLAQQSLEQCKDMQKAGAFTWGDYSQRLKNIKEKYGDESNPNFDMIVAEPVINAQEMWEQWAKQDNGGGAFENVDLVGIGIIQDPLDAQRFYITQYFSKEVIQMQPDVLIAELFKLQNEHRKKLSLPPFELKQELTDAALGLSNDMFIKKGITYGDYIGRAKTIREKLGDKTRSEFHFLITTNGDAKAIMQKWACELDAPRRDIDGPFKYTGFGVIFDKGKYYIAQYVAN